MDDQGPAAEAVAAARQLALILCISGLFTLSALIASPMSKPAILAIAAAHLAAAAATWAGPWHRWGLGRTAAPGMLALILLSATTWAFDGFAAGLGPLFILVLAWFGLHHRIATIAGAVPVAAIGYATALVVADARLRLVVSTLVLMPIAATVSVLIARTVGRLRETQRELQVKDRWRAALIATMAHDVRSPLSTVIGVLEVLEDDPVTSAKHQRLLDSAGRQTRRVVRLAVGILEAERMEQGKMRLERHEVDLAALAHEVGLLTQVDDVRVDIDPAMTVLADRERLEQVLYNLVNNSLRHGRPPVVISATQADGRTEICVTDHGDGVPAAEISNLFDRFSSADHSPHSVGLGLWIVRLLVEAHGGTVRYDPSGAAARFVISLPDGAPAARSSLTSTRDDSPTQVSSAVQVRATSPDR